MIRIDKKIIDAEVITILEEVKRYRMERDGKVILKDINETGNNIMVTCPFHKDGNERKPSCGISSEETPNTPAGTVHCFTCGKNMHFDRFISYLLGVEDGGSTGRKWLLEHFDVSYTRQINVQLARGGRQSGCTYNIIREAQLQQYRFYHPYMFKRGLTEEIIERYDVGYDKYNDMITFPVRDIQGNCLFLAKRSVKGKFFILPQGKNKPLYGVYELDYSKPDIYIVESFFNALTLAKWGYNAIAMMGTGSNYQYELINKLPFRTIHLCLDGDMAGRHGAMKLEQVIDKGKLVYTHQLPDGKDVNDLEKKDFLAIPYKIREC